MPDCALRSGSRRIDRATIAHILAGCLISITGVCERKIKTGREEDTTNDSEKTDFTENQQLLPVIH
jgi:hypothetical protein